MKIEIGVRDIMAVQGQAAAEADAVVRKTSSFLRETCHVGDPNPVLYTDPLEGE